MGFRNMGSGCLDRFEPCVPIYDVEQKDESMFWCDELIYTFKRKMFDMKYNVYITVPAYVNQLLYKKNKNKY